MPLDELQVHHDRGVRLHQAARDCFSRKTLKENEYSSNAIAQDDASYFLTGAALSWKIVQEWDEAAECLEEASRGMWNIGETHEALMVLSESAELRERVNPFDAIEVYRKAISIACQLSRYREAGRYQSRVAELYEECHNHESAAAAYKDAASFYSATMLHHEAQSCYLKYTTLTADLGIYEVAYEAFIELAKSVRRHNLTKSQSRGYLFKAGLISLAQGKVENLRASLQTFLDIDCGFVDSREGAFLQAMLQVRSPSTPDKLDAFADDLYDYDTVAPFDPWSIRMLRNFKRFVEEDAENDRRQLEKEIREKARLARERNSRSSRRRRREAIEEGTYAIQIDDKVEDLEAATNASDALTIGTEKVSVDSEEAASRGSASSPWTKAGLGSLSMGSGVELEGSVEESESTLKESPPREVWAQRGREKKSVPILRIEHERDNPDENRSIIKGLH